MLLQARRFEVIDEIVTAFETEYCKITDTQVREAFGCARNDLQETWSSNQC
jgi:NAD(P)H-nitrite reductase large subunit